MTKTIINRINVVLKYREIMFFSFIFSIILLICVYSFLLHSAIANVVEREKLVLENRQLSTRIGELEAEYFAIKNSIDMKMASKMGFHSSEVSMFINKKSITALLDHNEL